MFVDNINGSDDTGMGTALSSVNIEGGSESQATRQSTPVNLKRVNEDPLSCPQSKIRKPNLPEDEPVIDNNDRFTEKPKESTEEPAEEAAEETSEEETKDEDEE